MTRSSTSPRHLLLTIDDALASSIPTYSFVMPSNALPALVIDLDGTLIATDSLYESVLRGLRHRPLGTLQCVLAFFAHRSRVRLKQDLIRVAGLPDPALLPYREAVLSRIRFARGQGQIVVLATGAHNDIALAVAEHLDLFDFVCGTSNENLTGKRKREHFEHMLQGRPYVYFGDSSDDLEIWPHAQEAVAVSPSRVVAKRLRRTVPKAIVIEEHQGTPWRAIFRQMRVHQWSKSALVFIPVIASHKILDGLVAGPAFLAALAFSFMASTIYIVNDLFDLEGDRHHPSKRHRPIAAGTLSIPLAMTACLATLLMATAIGSLAGRQVVLALYCYGAMSLAYTLRLKRVLVLDVVVLASLYCMRVVVGGLAANITLSPWLLAFMIFEFFGLALVKRSVELGRMTEDIPGRGYRSTDRPTVRILGAGSTLLGVLVMSLYLQDINVTSLYPHAQLLWLIVPLLLYWSGRLWILEDRGIIDDDPLQFVVRDRVSIMTVVAMLLAVLAASQTAL